MDTLTSSARRRLRDLRDAAGIAGKEFPLSTGSLWKVFREGEDDAHVQPFTLNRVLLAAYPGVPVAALRRWILVADPAGCPDPSLIRPEDEEEWRIHRERTSPPHGVPAPVAAPEAAEPHGKEEVAPPPPKRRRVAWFAAGAAATVVAVALGASELDKRRVVTPSASGNTVSGMTAEGVAWTRTHTASVAQLVHAPWGRRTWVYGLLGGAADGGEIHVVDGQTGSPLWSASPQIAEIAAVFGAGYASRGAMACERMCFAEVDGDGALELIVQWRHHVWYPNVLAVFRQDGTRLGAYHHFGVLYFLLCQDLDADGKDEIIAAGTNNGRAYQGATVVILDDEHLHGAGADSLNGQGSALAESAIRRLILPQFDPEFMRPGQRLEVDNLVLSWTAEDELRITVSIREFGVLVTLDADLRPLQVALSDASLGYVAAWPEEKQQRFLSGEHLEEWIARYYLYGEGGLRAVPSS